MDNKNNLEEFSKKSQEYYSQIKAELEAKYKGKYMALDFELKKYWLGETATDALSKAKADYPEKLFYLLQIGFPTTFSIEFIATFPHSYQKYDFTR